MFHYTEILLSDGILANWHSSQNMIQLIREGSSMIKYNKFTFGKLAANGKVRANNIPTIFDPRDLSVFE